MDIAVVGLSYKTAPVEIRERLSIPEAQIAQAIAHLSSYSHVEEAVILSTCNRLEIYVAVTDMKQATQEVTQFLAKYSQLPFQELYNHLFVLQQQDVVRYLMQVAAGLDSQVLGEGQILSQVKHAHKLGQEFNGTGCTLNQLFKLAITIAKRIRAETAIGTGAVSVSSAAVELAQLKAKNLQTCQVMIVGAGKMSRRLIQHLIAKGVTQISIVNRSLNRAKELAEQFSSVQLKYYPLTELLSIISISDLVFTSTASTKPLIDRAKLEVALAPNQPLMLFDISVPRNVDADVNELPQVQGFNVDDLNVVVARNQESRKQVAVEAQIIIDESVEGFRAWRRSRETVSTISCLREKIESIREQELKKALSRLGAESNQKHQEVVEALSRGIVNKILHEPIVQLRTLQDLETQRLALGTLQVLFNLDMKEQYTSMKEASLQK